MQPRTALAFAPPSSRTSSSIHDEAARAPSRRTCPWSGRPAGDSPSRRGSTRTHGYGRARPNAISVAVNGDASYPADTTRKAVELLLEAARQPPLLVELVQTVEVPIGLGFGSSSASALSAVMAVAAALELKFGKEQVASFAHQADILCRTGLGTVSSTYNHSGAGLIVEPGGPGVAKVLAVHSAPGVSNSHGGLSPKPKGALLSSTRRRNKVNKLGEIALEQASDLRFESLLAAGRAFALGLGLMTPRSRAPRRGSHWRRGRSGRARTWSGTRCTRSSGRRTSEA